MESAGQDGLWHGASMRYIGIVGHEAKKFTAQGEEAARACIRRLLSDPLSVMVSGGCHLGGIDIWAEEEADKLGREKVVHKPTKLRWSGAGGFEERNMLIATHSPRRLLAGRGQAGP